MSRSYIYQVRSRVQSERVGVKVWVRVEIGVSLTRPLSPLIVSLSLIYIASPFEIVPEPYQVRHEQR